MKILNKLKKIFPTVNIKKRQKMLWNQINIIWPNQESSKKIKNLPKPKLDHFIQFLSIILILLFLTMRCPIPSTEFSISMKCSGSISSKMPDDLRKWPSVDDINVYFRIHNGHILKLSTSISDMVFRIFWRTGHFRSIFPFFPTLIIGEVTWCRCLSFMWPFWPGLS